MFTLHPRFLRTHSSGPIAHRECVTNATATIGFWLKLTRRGVEHEEVERWSLGRTSDQKPVEGIRGWWMERERKMLKIWGEPFKNRMAKWWFSILRLLGENVIAGGVIVREGRQGDYIFDWVAWRWKWIFYIVCLTSTKYTDLWVHFFR